MDEAIHFTVFKDHADYRWTINEVRTGDVIARSERYRSKREALTELSAVRDGSARSPIEDRTGDA